MKLALALALTACGGSSHPAGGDAPITSADTASPDADTGMITVSLRRGTVPIAAAPVVSQDGEGNVVASYVTEANGDAVLPSAGVGMVTVIDTDQSQLYTAVGVAGGDHITIPTFSEIATYGTVDVTLPAAPPGAVGFEVFTGDAFGGGSTVAAPFAIATTGLDVGHDGMITVIGLARDVDYNIIAVATATGVTPPAQGSTISVTTGAWSTAFDEFHLGVANGTLGDLVNSTQGQNIGGVEYALPSLTGNNSYIRWWPLPSLGGYVEYSAQIPFGTPTGGGNYPANRFQARRLAPDATSDNIDIAALLPGLTATSADSTNVARPTLTWTAAASTAGARPRTAASPDGDAVPMTAGADGVVLNTQWNGAQYGQWAFLLPPTQTSVQFPALPASLATWAPTVAVAQPYAVLIDTTFDASYADFRGDGFGLVGGPQFLHDGTGTLLGSMYFPQPF